MNKKVLVTDKVHSILLDNFKNAGFLVDYIPDIPPSKTKEILHQYHIIIINTKTKMGRDMIDAAPLLECIGRLGSGLDIIDVEYAHSKNIHVYSAPEGNRNAVAEHALGMLLALLNNLCLADQEVRQFKWNREKWRGYELKGLTVGIVGFGNTGSTFAKKLSGMGVLVLAHDKYKKHFAENDRYVIESSFERIQEEADIISFHLPLTNETLHYCDDAYLLSCKKNVIFINTSRGKVIQTSTLVKGLKSGKIRGACLDVFENERPNTYNESEVELYKTLSEFKNVLLSPHVAGWTFESFLKIGKILSERIVNNYRGL